MKLTRSFFGGSNIPIGSSPFIRLFSFQGLGLADGWHLNHIDSVSYARFLAFSHASNSDGRIL
jgi:hypothetical protein